ncbi:DNA-directed RNA polymerase I subunit rpa1-like [Teratosphaeria destructans]|uniref:DNA-directed RNA polymerase n=1 Tax=Teratosphaeria destructans TaxID=418781 RepID=A0A9W7SS06_9PEZI|nr:DNA-directed RNA polymerase I subunit rpa1-like [Teratosphaeria destructans]
MNISQPVSSQIGAVSFNTLTTDDIRALSAKRITSPTTFDTLLNPIPGGLYTPELGSLATMPAPRVASRIHNVPVTTLRLMRAACIYCGKLKMSRVHVHRFICKLELVKYGLVNEARDVDDLNVQNAHGAGADKVGSDSDDASDDDMNQDARDLMKRRDRFVKTAISIAKHEGRLSTAKTEASVTARKAIVSEFMSKMTTGKKCANCQGVNHSYRKDRFVKIFRKPLSDKDRLAMIQSGHRAKDPVVEMRRKARAERSRKRKRDADEGIADMGVSDEEEGDDVNMDDESEVEIAGGDVEEDAAVEGTKSAADPKEEYLNPSRVYAYLAQLFERDQEVLAAVYGHVRRKPTDPALTPDMFFVRDVLVPPNRYRPEARTGNDEIAEAQENTLYKNILNVCETLASIQRELAGKETRESRYRARTYSDFENTWITLQDAVNSLIDRDRNPIQGAAGRRNPDGIKQKLEKKEGMFRKYMMGKRVNFAARTVISPDPNIETNEIGVPPVFAIKLTYPEPVTQWNLEELQEAVRNGPHEWPGAVAIESETGQVINLERKNAEERTALANQLLAPSVGAGSVRGTRPKKVHRHLNNGDIVIMNRQPTLHKPSMMCHRARVLPGEKTLRMHYANCNTYNADFDGDEMNMHFPQNELARAEALMIADTDHQYLSATAGNPLRGLIQDHISMSLWLTSRDTMFERGDYMQLMYAALRPESGHCSSGRVQTVPPAILKPKPLWTGKQVVTSLLLNLVPAWASSSKSGGLTMTGKATTDPKLWGTAGAKEEGNVIFKDGYLCQGILDKKQIGPASGGFVNSVYEVYGDKVAGRLLSVLGRMLTKLEGMRAFSCGVEDLVFTREGEERRREALAGAETVGLDVAAKYVGLEERKPKSNNRVLKERLEEVLRDDTKQHGLDQLTNAATAALSSSVTNACLPDALMKPFPRNQMQTMTMSGAKGTKVNANQISCNLGQQVLEGRRVPVMVSGKTLPCFKPFESSVRAGGYIVDRFLTGVRPQEFFFHAMAGREGLIDTAVKTSRSGYLQRCLIKGMEGLKVEYDTSVRDTDGSVVQFLYGEDGLDVAKSKYLADFKFTAENHEALFQAMGVADDFARVRSEEASEYNKSAYRKWKKFNTASSNNQSLDVSEPALSMYPPSRYAGSTSEKMYMTSRAYADENPDKLLKDKKKNIEGLHGLGKKTFHAMMDIRYLKSVVEAGEAVGVVAGQSVGEPSTQMTLNTFHLAGHAAKNVTLGIPRLREIVMTAAKKISTPLMTLRIDKDTTLEGARRFAKSITRLSVSEILDKITVTESQGKGVAYGDAKKYEVRLDFFPSEEYKKEYAIQIEDVAYTLEGRFLEALHRRVRKELKKRGDEKSLRAGDKSKASDALPEVGKSSGRVEEETARGDANREGGDDDSDAEGDDDATRDKSKSNKQQAGYEAYEDQEENELAKKNQKDDDEEEAEDEAYGGSPKAPVEDDEDSEDGEEEAFPTRKGLKATARERLNRIRSEKRTNDVTAFSFDDVDGSSCTFTMEYAATTAKILMLHLVETAAREALIHNINGITAAMVDEKATELPENVARGHKIVAVSGCNIVEMWNCQNVIDPHTLYTNSIGDMLAHYGVEAARAAIVVELQSVFGGHGISVDPRHLTLIADFMTRGGGYAAFSRMGYRGVPSVLMKASFETTLSVLKDAVLEGDGDGLEGPSARIVTGRLGRMGTGGFDLFLPVREGVEGDEDVEMEG